MMDPHDSSVVGKLLLDLTCELVCHAYIYSHEAEKSCQTMLKVFGHAALLVFDYLIHIPEC